jgi:predicted Fe-S protein YdhL (DUF1289 family)
MFFSLTPHPRPILTPCIGVCEIDAEGLCRGCHRTLDEIARWSALGDAERARLMNEILPRRAADHAAS